MDDPADVTFTETPFELLFTTAAGPVSLDGAALVYLNELNLWLPAGIVAGFDGSQAVLRASLPITEGRTPHPDVVRALVATLNAVRRVVLERRMPSHAEQREVRIADAEVPGGPTLETVAVAFGSVVPLTTQADGSRMAACRYEAGSFMARLSWTAFDGFCFDALGLGDASCLFDAGTLEAVLRLNARLPVGGFALWQAGTSGMLVFRRALPLRWLGHAAEPNVTLVSEDFVRSCLENASGAWEAVEELGIAGTAKPLPS